MKNSIPNYKKIYTDILNVKYPHKKEICADILSKRELLTIDIILLNQKIFNTDQKKENQKYRSYDKATIFKILDYQKKFSLNNTQLAKHFNLSRNTVSKWKKYFQ
ncbi:hypothetical protein CLU96_3309 [Chryseobacterium sp. 52]|uniref:transposase n=1 Tax=Chryseobacterium sp. 52 TaxID=2035213 RepID=UPI000C18983A|nr:transposase [Chryseobacterium sp. 52]PIF46284.1 hypothetical protein CLU96_3309 [Chryseobacterium sp. 52]